MKINSRDLSGIIALFKMSGGSIVDVMKGIQNIKSSGHVLDSSYKHE